MFTLKVENKNNQLITLTQNESDYQVVDIEGLNPPKANIYTNAVASIDGEKFKSSKLEMRNIVLTLKINGDIEANRLHLYNYFATGKWCKIYYSNETRNVFIEGYCETIECPLFTMNQQMQISIVCPDPYFKSMLEIYADISKVFSNFEFPFDIAEEGIEFSVADMNRVTTILNNGESDTGLLITITALEHILNAGITIYDVDTTDFMKLWLSVDAGDVIIINTNKGSKSVKRIRNGVESNIVNNLDGNSTWLQLKTGINKFTYTTQNENDDLLKIELKSNLLYEGV